MNVIQTIDKELSERHLTDFEKARYIYLRSCELFSFDFKWFYTLSSKDRKLKEEMEKRRVDLENVDSFEVICHQKAPILKTLLDELTSLDSKVISTYEHSYVNLYDHNGIIWKLNSAYGDMQRVKINIKPNDMSSSSEDSEKIIEEIDFDLGYNYVEDTFYRNLVHGIRDTDKLHVIANIINASKAKYHYSDVYYYFNLLSSSLGFENETYFDKEYNFHRLIPVNNEGTYFDLSKENDEYSLKEIHKSDYDCLVKTLRYK